MASPLGPRRGPFSSQLLRDEATGYDEALATQPEPKKPTNDDRQKKLVELAMERFRLVVEVEGDQRDREVEDLQFDRALPEDQWPAELLAARAKGIAPDGTVIPERPCLVIPKLDQPVQAVINEARKARLGIVIKPKGEKANKDGAELRQGMIRAIEVDSRANIARIWALERAVKCGRGVYRVLKTYANDHDFDLDLVVTRIKNQGAVYLDPHAQEPDWSDGEFAFITDDMPIREYKRTWPDSEVANMSAEELVSVSDKAKDWVTGGDEGTIRVAEYFYTEYEERVLVLNPVTGKGELLEAGAKPPSGDTKWRLVQKRIVKWAYINAHEVLDEEEWEGRWIPLVPVIGKEYNVDGEACFKGVVSNAKDAQRLYNYARSSQALRSGLESLAPWVLAEGQDEGYEQMWNEANTRAFTTLKYKPTTFEGHLLPPPQRNDLSSTNLSASVLMAREADSDIQATTGRFNPSLGKQDVATRSGRAIQRLQQQGEQASSNYLDNLANISMVHEGRILLDLLPHVYDRPGRIVRLLGEDPKDERQVMLKQPFVPGPQGPIPTAPNTPGLIPALMQRFKRGKPPEPPKEYDLDDGDYTVTVTVGQGFATDLEAKKAYVLGLMQAAPSAAPYLIDIAAELEGSSIGTRIAKRFQQINPQLKGEEEQDGTEVPPAIQAQMTQMAQENQQLKALVGKLQSGVEVEQVRIAGQKEMKAMELASRERIEAAKIAAGATKTGAELDSKESIAVMEEKTKRQSQVLQQRHDHAMRQVDAAHDDRAASREAALKDHAADRDAQREDHAADRQVRREDHAAVRDAALEPVFPRLKADRAFTPPSE